MGAAIGSQRRAMCGLIGRFRLSVTDADSGAAQLLPADVQLAIEKPADQRTRAESAAIAAVALKAYAERKIAALPPRATVYGVSSSWSHASKLSAPQAPKVVHLLRRGAFDKPVREVAPGALTAITDLPGRFEIPDLKQESHRRAALRQAALLATGAIAGLTVRWRHRA